MHALWSRAAQAQSSCRCRGCLHTATTITRRATTAASRRRVTAADIFTACYTTILGTAAVVDAHRKEGRKKELDEKLDRARAALGNLAIQEAPNRNEARESSSDTPGSLETPVGTSQWEAGIPSTSVTSLLQELGDLAASTYRSTTRSWRQHQVDWAAIEAAISAEEQDLDIEIRHPYTEAQLARTTQTIESLVRQLLWRCRESQVQKTQDTQLSETLTHENIVEEVEKLRSGPHYPSYENPRSDLGGAAEERVLLNDSFRRIFGKAADVKEVVGKICYNLLLSSTPPNIHNYNVLIAGFNRIQRPDLAQAVVDSYLADTRWPATQQTIVCLLNHAVATNDIEQFRTVVRRMRGVAEDGLHFRIVSKNAIFNSHGLLWAEANCASRKHAWVERAKRGNDVFDNLIKGWLHFSKVDVACMSFVACLREGRYVPVDTIQGLLTECHSSLDQGGARKLLKGLAKNYENFEALMKTIHTSSPSEITRSIAEMFYSLFDLSGLPHLPIIGGVKKFLRIILRKFKSLQIITEAQIGLDEIESSSREIMRSLGAGNPYSGRVTRALATLTEKPHESQTDVMPKKETYVMSTKGFVGIAKLAALLKHCQNLEAKSLRIEAHVKVSIIYALTGIHCDPQSRLPPIDWQNRQRYERYPAVFHALRSIKTKDLSSGKNLRRQLLNRLPDRKLAKQLRDLALWKNLEFDILMSLYQDGPNTSKRVRTRQEQTSPEVDEIEGQLENVEDATRSVLFSFMAKGDQRNFRKAYPNWYEMPLAKLYEYHHQNIDGLKSPDSGRLVVEMEEDEANVTEVAAVLGLEAEQLPLASGGWPCISPPARLCTLGDRRQSRRFPNDSCSHTSSCSFMQQTPWLKAAFRIDVVHS
ncbi:hypothetical protein PG993_007171 [Apiospora rasikravindrae]|uniref:Pentatricopeptide repeat domain-containing protein n=1 Tax=Apiospora rasikravindrae TaxID=990691 RepID=A0ABR1SWR4_9PEZI